MKDKQLIDRILRRDRASLYALYHTHVAPLRRLIQSKVAVAEDAEEILQDTLFAFLEAIRDFQGESSLKTYLFSICQHKIIDYYRRRRLKQVVFSKLPSLEVLISPMLNPEEQLDVNLLKEKIHLVLDRLLPNYRQVLIFKYLDSLSVVEIARRLKVSFKSAESQLFRARKAFVELFLSI